MHNLAMKILSGGAAGFLAILNAGPAVAMQDPIELPTDLPPPPGLGGVIVEERDPDANAARRLLSAARQLESEKGCAEAIPAFRAAAGFGGDNAGAQYELAACLLSSTAIDGPVALQMHEGLFWLERAAHSGDPRAQRELAILYASPAEPLHDPEIALGWAYVFESNSRADILSTPLPRTMVNGLEADIGAEAAARALGFAAAFNPTPMAQFVPPRDEARSQRASPASPRGPEGGQRRRPR